MFRRLRKIEKKLDVTIQKLSSITQNTSRPYPVTPPPPKVSGWLDTPPNSNLALFKAISEKALERTVAIVQKEMPDAMVFIETDDFLKYTLEKADLQGAHAEFGVYSGRTINLFAKERPDVVFDGFDSFEGLPEEWVGWQPFDFDRKGSFPEVEHNVKLHKGWFSETLPDYAAKIDALSFMHVDCDIYSSTKTIFDTLKKQIRPGCVIVFDEYFCYPNFEKHERLAFSEFLDDTGYKANWIAVCGQRAACIIS